MTTQYCPGVSRFMRDFEALPRPVQRALNACRRPFSLVGPDITFEGPRGTMVLSATATGSLRDRTGLTFPAANLARELRTRIY